MLYHFDLDSSDVEVIEACLRKELHCRAEEYQESVNEDHAEGPDSSKHGMSEITEILGKIHNQKIWGNGETCKPSVPQG
ncbi:MAG: hypothetical protein GY948_17370 [Alphaproteobacteria bacterium]|nr:hypothetical protein [Alphaproteobacteria bacterium]